MRKFKITYKDETFLSDGKRNVVDIDFGTMQENDNGERTIQIQTFPKVVFDVREIK